MYQKLPNFLKWEVFIEKLTFYNDKTDIHVENNQIDAILIHHNSIRRW